MRCDYCDGEGGNLPPIQKARDAQKIAKHEAEAERRKCANGNSNHCSNVDKLLGQISGSTFGIRIEGSAWLMGGADLNIDILFFGRSKELGLFVSPGSQGGDGGGISITGGILISKNMPSRGSYAGPAYGGGTSIPVVPLGIQLEGEYSISPPNPDGTLPQTTYIGLGPLTGEAGSYANANVAFPIIGFWKWVSGN
jgi:hypothetical protein